MHDIRSSRHGNPMILFLDFDGVLHPFPMGSSDRHFSATAPLWRILNDIPEIKVVVTSTWRERYSFPELIALLAAHGGEPFRDRFLDVTPIMENDVDYVPGIRQREVEAWLESNMPAHTSYIILDDIEEYFDASCRNLYLVDGATGLTDRDVEMIPLWLGSLCT